MNVSGEPESTANVSADMVSKRSKNVPKVGGWEDGMSCERRGLFVMRSLGVRDALVTGR